MIDNINIIKPLLKFESEDDYYFLQILMRKKDKSKFNTGGSNNNSRLIRAYQVSSIEYLEKRYEEIKALCDLFGARAGICLNKRSFKSSSLQMMVRLAQSIQSNNHRNSAMWNNVSGVYHPTKDKTWIVDVDSEDANNTEHINSIRYFINKQKPEGDKIMAVIPSRSGFHFITKPFDQRGFEEFNLDVHKNNPTNLYIPDFNQ